MYLYYPNNKNITTQIMFFLIISWILVIFYYKYKGITILSRPKQFLLCLTFVSNMRGWHPLNGHIHFLFHILNNIIIFYYNIKYLKFIVYLLPITILICCITFQWVVSHALNVVSSDLSSLYTLEYKF